MPGPIPKRSEERRRTNSPEPEKVDIDELWKDAPAGSLQEKIAAPIVVPDFDGDWFDGKTIKADPKGDYDVAEDNEIEAEVWHPLAQQLWESFSSSGQALYWQPTDWIIAAYVCETISRSLKPQIIGYRETGEAETRQKTPIWGPAPVKGADLSAIMKAAGGLMLVEGERRRLQLELKSRYASDEPKIPEGTNVVSISRKALLAQRPKTGAEEATQ